jgi:hypothetical protein
MKDKFGKMGRVAAWTLGGIVFTAFIGWTQTAPSGPVLTLNAASDTAGSIKIDILRWSTDAERDKLVMAWTMPVAPAPEGGGRGGRAAKGGAKQTAAPAAEGRGGGKGGRGGRGGNAGPSAPPPTPESSLVAAIGGAPTVGYLWSSSEVAGYALRSAVRLPSQDGGERIILITDRRLGAWNDAWKAQGSPTNYDFSVIELRLNSKGTGEGRASLTGKVSVDAASKTIGLENYGELPVVLKNVTTHKK